MGTIVNTIYNHAANGTCRERLFVFAYIICQRGNRGMILWAGSFFLFPYDLVRGVHRGGGRGVPPFSCRFLKKFRDFRGQALRTPKFSKKFTAQPPSLMGSFTRPCRSVL